MLNIVARQIDNGVLTGYILRDSNTKKIIQVDKSVAYEMALNRQINNVRAQIYKGKVSMKGLKFKISDLPAFDKYGNRVEKEQRNNKSEQKNIITHRIIRGRVTVGYAIDTLINGIDIGREVVSKDDTIQLIKEGKISNARCQEHNGRTIIRGNGVDMSSLPKIYVK